MLRLNILIALHPDEKVRYLPVVASSSHRDWYGRIDEIILPGDIDRAQKELAAFKDLNEAIKEVVNNFYSAWAEGASQPLRSDTNSVIEPLKGTTT